VHCVAQSPQWFPSVCSSAHVVPQTVKPVAQAHTPLLHVCPATAQCTPHVPQLFGSVCSSAQAPLQSTCPLGQAHVPALHVCPEAHWLSQRPQSATADWRSTQSMPQIVRPGAHAHLPCEHDCPAPEQTFPQAPQFAMSEEVSMHVPAHIAPTLHAHVPELQKPVSQSKSAKHWPGAAQIMWDPPGSLSALQVRPSLQSASVWHGH
jgi:hypothetical protein